MPTYTYTESLIGSPTIHKARLQIGDRGKLTKEDGTPLWLMSDEELQALIGTNGENYNEGVATACDGLISQFAQEPDRYEDETRAQVEWKNRLKGWENLSKRLRLTPPNQTVEGATPPPTALSGVMIDPPGINLLGLP